MIRYGTRHISGPSDQPKAFLFAPAGAIKEPYLARGIDLVQQAGIQLQQGKSLLASPAPFAAGDADLRLDDWQQALRNRCDCILPARGGYGCVDLMKQAPFANTAELRPLWVGSSDCTFLQVPLLQKHGLVTFYGPMPCGQLTVDDQVGRDAFLALLAGDYPEAYSVAEQDVLVEGAATGELRGGCLSILASLCGTEDQLDGRDAILILEDIGEHPFRVERMLKQMERAGVFDGAKGVALGMFPGCHDRSGDTSLIVSVLRNFFQHLGVPALFRLPIGHGYGAIPIPLGVAASIKDNRLTIEESPFAD